MTEGFSEISKLLRGELCSGDGRLLVRRLLAQAARPNLRTGRRAAISMQDLLPAGLSRVAERSGATACEHRELPALLHRLLAVPVEGRRDLLVTDPAFHSAALCEWLMAECLDVNHTEALRADSLADLAVSLADQLPAERYGEPLVNDLRARSWTCAGEVLRNMADLQNAEAAFGQAETHLEKGSGDGLETAWLLEAQAALLRDRGQVLEAHRLIDETIEIYRRYRDFHRVGRAFVRKGEICSVTGDLGAAVRWLRKGIGLLDPTRERRLELAARLSLMLALHDSDRHREAWFLLKASRSEFQEHGGELLYLRLVWLEGKIQQVLGAPGEAEASLAEARRGFIAQGVGFDAAAASLDLALLYAGQGRSAEMRRLSEEMLVISSAKDLHREALAALIVFQQAVRMDRASSDLLAEIRAYLQRARRDSRLRFEVSD